MRVPDPDVLVIQRPPLFREGRDLVHHVPACSEGARACWGGGGLLLVPPHFCWGGGDRGSKKSAPQFPGPQGEPAHGLHPRFVVAEIWADRVGMGGGGGGGGGIGGGGSGRANGGGYRRGWGGGGLREGRLEGGSKWGNSGWWWGGGSRWGDLGCWGGRVQVGRFGVLGGEGGHRLPLPPLALPLTIPSP